MTQAIQLLQEKLATQPISDFALHTHDRIAFRRCRLKWLLSSPLKMNLEPLEGTKSINLWFGSGIHFAMEDYHGYNRFGDPKYALEAYYNAFKEEELPTNADDMTELGMRMLDYYTQWLPKHNFDKFETVWLNQETGEWQMHSFEGAVPLVEVGVTLELTELSATAGFPVYYHGTLDRVVCDAEGRWWILDYKTAAQFDTNKLPLDTQIGAYLWMGEQVLNHPIEGMVYLQLQKDAPNPVKRLTNGSFSKDKRQKTTHAIYRQTLLDEFGKIPSEYVEILNELASNESYEGDKFIRWDMVRLNDSAKINNYAQILDEGRDMLDPELRIYPNPTRDCAWDCPYRNVCLSMYEGANDVESQLTLEFQKRNETMKQEEEPWRKHIKWPKEEI